MSATLINVLQRLPRTPLATDLFVYVQVDLSKPANLTPPAFGTPYNSMTGAPKYDFPNHKFAWRSGPDRQGMYTDVYLADLPTQHLYNWHISDEPEWPTITQTFIVPRSTYVANPVTPEATYPPPPNTVVGPTGYVITGISEVRSQEDVLDTLYVVVQVTREKLDVAQTWDVLDPDTGTIRTFQRQKVPAGTPGSTVNANGSFQETNPINSKWSLLNTEYAAGLAGSAVAGVSSRTWKQSVDYYWPPVLDYVNIQVVTVDPADAFSDFAGYIVSTIWLVDQYNGPCEGTVVETWYNTVPPDILPDVLLPTEIDFQGPELRVQVPRCLHEDVTFFEAGYSQFFRATSPAYWPPTLIVDVDVRPQWNGWIQRVTTINAPTVQGLPPGILLEVTASDATSFTLSWTPETGTPAFTTSVNVATDPTFNSGFLPGYQGVVVAIGTNTLVVEGPAQGRYYYAQVTRNAIESNIVTTGAKPDGVLQVSSSGIILESGDILDAGSVAPGAAALTPITLTNLGALNLGNISASVADDPDNQYSVSAPATALAPGQTSTFNITFSPTEGGIQTATVEIAHDGAGTSPFLLQVTGSGITPIMQVEQPLNTILPTGGTSNFGTVTVTPVALTFYVRNVGTANLTGIAAEITGDNAADYDITVPIVDTTLAPTAVTSFQVTFDPVEDTESSNTRTATLTLTSNTTAYTVELTGIFNSPTAPGAVDPTYIVDANGPIYAIAITPEGAAIVGGNFSVIGGESVLNLARVSSVGVVDPSFTPTPNGSVYAIAVQEDGKIIVGGAFDDITANAVGYLGRVLADGTYDGTFVANLDQFCYALAIQSNGQVIVGGEFNTVNASAKEYLARVETDGSLDVSFDSEVNGAVRGIEILTDGKMMIVGDFVGTVTTPPPTTVPVTTTEPPTTSTEPPTTSTEPPTTAPPTTSTVPPTTTSPPTTEPPETTTLPPETTTPPP